jgi:hypothetical protein
LFVKDILPWPYKAVNSLFSFSTLNDTILLMSEVSERHGGPMSGFERPERLVQNRLSGLSERPLGGGRDAAIERRAARRLAATGTPAKK